MNFLKNEFFSRNDRRKNIPRRKTDVLFFHTVREGTRKAKGRTLTDPRIGDREDSLQGDGSSLTGRTVVRRANPPVKIFDLDDGKAISVVSILGNHGSDLVSTKDTTQNRKTDNDSFFKNLEPPAVGGKRKKFEIAPWEFQPSAESMLTSPVAGPSRIDTAPERLRRHIYLDDPDDSTSTTDKRSEKCGQKQGDGTAPSGESCSSNKDSFFKVPRLPTSSLERYDNLFATPSRVKALPKITTPHLFPVVTKSTPINKTSSSTSKLSSVKTPKSVGTVDSDPTYTIVALTEGRGCAVGEVGLAVMDIRRPILVLCQFSDSQTYKKVMAKLNVFNPAEIIVPDTFEDSKSSVLYTAVTRAFPDMTVITVKRQHFSAKLGLESIRTLCLPEDSSVEMVVLKKYYTLAAAEALLKYLEFKHDMIFSSKMLKINYESATDIVSIDLETCRRLELVLSNADMINPEKYSLFGLLNHTVTLGGKRKLRSCLLQAWSSSEIINMRQYAVAALVADQVTLNNLQTVLLKFSDAERLLWLCTKTPNFKNESKTSETLTTYILLLKSCIEALPSLKTALDTIEDDYILSIRDDLYDDRFKDILVKIRSVIHEDAKPTKGFAASARQRCFAIKEGVNPLLDVARSTYSNLIEKVMELIAKLGEEHKMALRMSQSADLGFHAIYLKPKGVAFDQKDLPEVFTEVRAKGRTIHLATDEMHRYNMRIHRAQQEVQLISNVVMYELTESLRAYMGCLYRLCETTSELDYLSCLAKVSSSSDYTRPTFGETTQLTGARHPIMDHLRPTRPIPNNVYASRTKNFNIITGPNMGGKTVYVLQIPLIQIMAQMGCYVPADQAVIRITNHIYVRKGNADSMECRASSFTVEIKELVYTMKNLTDTSLIIFDELCTGTTTKEGTAVAWAFCEELLRKSAFTFLVTHYHYLTNLEKVFPNVTNYQMEAVEREELQGLTLTHRLIPGVTQETNYGLKLIMNSSLPEEIKKGALEIAEEMVRRRASSLPLVVPFSPAQEQQCTKIDKIETFMENLYKLSLTDNFTTEMVQGLQRMALAKILNDEQPKETQNEPGGSVVETISSERNLKETTSTQMTPKFQSNPENGSNKETESSNNSLESSSK